MVVLTEKQQKIFEWLDNKLQLSVYANAYKGAVFSLKTKSPGYVTFVSHVARDLMNSLPRAVAGIRSSQVQYRQHLDQLQIKWKDKWRGQGLGSPQQDEGHIIPFSVCEMIAKLLNEHKEGHRRSRDAGDFFFDTFLGYSDKDKITNLSKWREARRFFLANTHLREKAFPAEVYTRVEENFNLLEKFLYIAATSEYSRIGSLDAILEEAQN